MKRLFAAALALPVIACAAASSTELSRSSSSADSTVIPCGCLGRTRVASSGSGSGSGGSSGGSLGGSSSGGAGMDECGGVSCPVQTGTMTLAPGQTNGVVELVAATAGPQTFAISGLPAGVTATGTYNAPTSDYFAVEVYTFDVALTTLDGPSTLVISSTDSDGNEGLYYLDLTIAGVCQPTPPPPGAQCGAPPDGCGGTLSLASCGAHETCDKYYDCQSTAPSFPTCPKGEHCE